MWTELADEIVIQKVRKHAGSRLRTRTDTHADEHTQMKLNEEFSAVGARPRSEPRPLGGQHQIKFCVERSREAPLPLARSLLAPVVFKEAKTNPTPGPKRRVELQDLPHDQQVGICLGARVRVSPSPPFCWSCLCSL